MPVKASIFNISLCNGYIIAQINILNTIDQVNTIFHGPLECFTAND